MQAFQAWNEGSIPSARTTNKFCACAGVGEPGQTVNLLSYDWGGSTPPTPTKNTNQPLRLVFVFVVMRFGKNPFGSTSSRFHKCNAVKSSRLPRRHLCRATPPTHSHQVKNIEKPGITPVFYFVGSNFTNLIKTQQNQYNFLFSTIEK